MRTRFITTLLVTALVTFGALFFIGKSNDHQECNETVEHSKDASGNLVTTTKHDCKETFNL